MINLLVLSNNSIFYLRKGNLILLLVFLNISLSILHIKAQTPNIAINTIYFATPNIVAGTSNNPIYEVSISPTLNDASLSSMSFTTGGTYKASDLTTNSFHLWYSTTNSFGTATQISTAATVGNGGTITFSSLGQSILNNTTGYFWLTVDVIDTADNGATISIQNPVITDFNFVAGNITLFTYSGNLITIIVSAPPIVKVNSIPVGVSNLSPSSNNNILYHLSIQTFNNTSLTLSDINFVTGGTYQNTDIVSNSFKLWYGGTVNNFATATLVTSAAVVNSGGTVSFPGLNVLINADVTVYYWLTVDISPIGNDGNTIYIEATTSSDIHFVNVDLRLSTTIGDTKTIVSPLSVIHLDNLGPAPANIDQGTSHNILYQLSIACNNNSNNLNSIQFITGGSYLSSDIVANSFKLWYNTSNSFSTASNVGTTGVVSSGGVLSYTGLSQPLSSNTTVYYWLTADIASSAALGNTIYIQASTSSDIVFSSGGVIINTADGGVQTISSSIPVITVGTVGNAAASINTGSSNNLLYQLVINCNYKPTTLNSIQFSTGGTYLSSDIVASSFKLWYSTSNSFSTASNVGTQGVVNSGGVLSYTGLSQAIASGATVYYWLTADISPTATNGNAIQILATNSSDLNFTSGSPTMNTLNGGLKTILGNPSILVNSLGTAASNINAGSLNNVLYQVSIGCTVNAITLNSIQFSTGGTYQGTDLLNNSFRLWFANTNSFAGANNVGVLNTVNSGGTLAFQNLNQTITAGSTVYYWLTVDLNGAATNGNTISIGQLQSSDILFNSSTKATLNTSAGGVKTIVGSPVKLEDAILPNLFSPNGDGMNDKLILRAMNISDIIEVTWEIFDKNGSRIFQCNDLITATQEGWDGGNYASGVYFYVLSIRFNDGISSQKKGTVTLIR